eukprot:TRINITY_DN7162_c0_g1_i5.p1 TRINITY_DN7162_c0_g1~~TRINITY_DN7162_c0_g1_i5.p1  ORF type:complete len:110 (-),score=2.91 TRINITY_DN7162_c0_g1_i5:74-403(-)
MTGQRDRCGFYILTNIFIILYLLVYQQWMLVFHLFQLIFFCSVGDLKLCTSNFVVAMDTITIVPKDLVVFEGEKCFQRGRISLNSKCDLGWEKVGLRGLMLQISKYGQG